MASTPFSATVKAFQFLLSRRGSLEFKRLHNKSVLNTPGLSWFPRSFGVFRTLLLDPVLIEKEFDPEEFLEGARGTYPHVYKLMLGLDSEFSPEEGDAEPLVRPTTLGGFGSAF